MLDENIEKLDSEELENNNKKESENQDIIKEGKPFKEVVNTEDKPLKKVAEKEKKSSKAVVSLKENEEELDVELNEEIKKEIDKTEDKPLEKAVEKEEKSSKAVVSIKENEGELDVELNKDIKKEIDKSEDKPLEKVVEKVEKLSKTIVNIKENEGELDVELNKDTKKEIVKAEDKPLEKAVEKEDKPSKAVVSIKENEGDLDVELNKDNKKEIDKTEDKPLEKVVEKVEKAEVPVIELEKLSLDELVEHLQDLLNKFSIQDVKSQIELLKSDFLKKFKNSFESKKAIFLSEGGNEIDFHYSSTTKNIFDKLIIEYKKKRQQYYNELDKNQKQNLERRLNLIEQLKELIDHAEASTMYKKFKNLQSEWKDAGKIPHTKYNDVWRTYHHHVERFYDLLHLNNDLRDLDFKHNLEEKSKLVEKAETLAKDKDVNHAFKELQILHKLWKEDIGPVSREFREEIWHRFSEATKIIHDKRHEFLDKLEVKLHENIDLKLDVIEKIKAIKIDHIDSHKLWQEQIRKLEGLRENFFKIGRVPKSKNEEIWQLFKAATKEFNKAKNEFYKTIKHEQAENLIKKMHLVDQAESLKDSEDWDITTEVYKKIQSEWRKIGHVPRKDSDKIWKRFKDACNYYFDRLHEKEDGASKGQTEIYNNKKEFLEKFKEKVNDEKSDLSLDMVNNYIKDWKSLGIIPVKMRHIDSKFNKVIDVAYKKLNIDKGEAAFLKFQNTVDSYVSQNDMHKLNGELLFVKRKADELTKEIKQLENNISFISNATADNPLVKNVYKNIENYHIELEIWKRKLSYLKQLDY